jgi:hypothetical protein
MLKVHFRLQIFLFFFLSDPFTFLFLSYLIFLRIFLMLFFLFLKFVTFVLVYLYMFHCLSSLTKSSYISSYKPPSSYMTLHSVSISSDFSNIKRKFCKFSSLGIFFFSVPLSFFIVVFLTFYFFPVFHIFSQFSSYTIYLSSLLSPSFTYLLYHIIFESIPIPCFLNISLNLKREKGHFPGRLKASQRLYLRGLNCPHKFYPNHPSSARWQAAAGAVAQIPHHWRRVPEHPPPPPPPSPHHPKKAPINVVKAIVQYLRP